MSALERYGPPFVAATIGAVCFHLSTGLGTFGPAAFVAPLPALVVAFTRSWRMAALVGFASHFLGSLALVAYLGGVLPVPIVLGVLAAMSLTFAAAVLLARFALRRLPASVAVCAFPAAWTSIEFLPALLSPHGTLLNLAYSQVDFLALLQVASVTGLWGVSFLLTLVPSALAVTSVCRAPIALVAPAIAVVLALGFGFWLRRLRQPARPSVSASPRPTRRSASCSRRAIPRLPRPSRRATPIASRASRPRARRSWCCPKRWSA